MLFGKLDAHTLEWEDGVFTHILRRVSAQYETGIDTCNVPARVWVVFDGDVDPVWAENLNSVLDDNRLFTLPTGDRLQLPDNAHYFGNIVVVACYYGHGE